jgi:pyruvate/2-oxoglutarate dehydrogenase complex dihydrolipoamide dehydrogenase (E3) component
VATCVNDKVHLRLTGTKGNVTEPELWVDHVIAATGYRPDASRLGFLDEKLRSRIERVQHAASVNQNFESSVPGLHLVGLASAHNFGPLCRFAYGAKYTSKRIAKHLSKTRLKAPKRTFKTKPVKTPNSESPAV